MSSTQFQIAQLRQENSTKLLEALVVFIAAFFNIALLPQLLVRYVYANQPLLETPPALEMIPVALFVAAWLYFLYALVGNFIRYNRIKLLEKDLMVMGDDCDCDHDHEHHHHDDLSDLEALVQEVEESMPATESLSQAMKKSSKSKSTTKRKSTRKKSK